MRVDAQRCGLRMVILAKCGYEVRVLAIACGAVLGHGYWTCFCATLQRACVFVDLGTASGSTEALRIGAWDLVSEGRAESEYCTCDRLRHLVFACCCA